MHDSILYSFLIAGHTKFSPDWCFGLIKQSFRRRNVSSLFDLMEAVDQSTVTAVNISKLCGLHVGSSLLSRNPLHSPEDRLFLQCGLL